MAKGLAGWFPIFRAGEHEDATGKKYVFSNKDIDNLIASYNPESPAACVVTHKELYSPFGYGAIDGLKRMGDVLMAKCKPESIVPAFAKLVKNGNLSNRSVMLKMRENKTWRLCHVAFLGADPPAIEDLRAVPFQAAVDGVEFALTLNESWSALRDARRELRFLKVLRQVGEWAKPKDETNPISEWEITNATEEVGAARERTRAASSASRATESTSMYSQTEDKSMTSNTEDEEKTFTQADIDAARQAGADKATEETTAKFAAESAATRKTAITGRVQTMVDAGKIPKADMQKVIALGVALPVVEVQFSAEVEGEEKTETADPVECLLSMVSARPPAVEHKKTIGTEGGDPALASAPVTADGEVTAEFIAGKVKEYRNAEAAKGNQVSLQAANEHVHAQYQRKED